MYNLYCCYHCTPLSISDRDFLLPNHPKRVKQKATRSAVQG